MHMLLYEFSESQRCYFRLTGLQRVVEVILLQLNTEYENGRVAGGWRRRKAAFFDGNPSEKHRFSIQSTDIGQEAVLRNVPHGYDSLNILEMFYMPNKFQLLCSH